MLFCLVIVATDASAFVRYFTRFTEEAFAALIGIIFIIESLKKLMSKCDLISCLPFKTLLVGSKGFQNYKSNVTSFYRQYDHRIIITLSEMSKTFKVHEDFDLEHLTWKDESCHCDPPGTRK